MSIFWRWTGLKAGGHEMLHSWNVRRMASVCAALPGRRAERMAARKRAVARKRQASR